MERALPKIAVVTGANTGIGKETARGLAAAGAIVVLAVRDLDKGEAARGDIVDTTGNADVHVMQVDLANKASILAFARAFEARFDRLDILVDNAGVWSRERRTTADGFEATFGVNHLGTFLLTIELLPLLRKSAPARVVVVSSAMHYRATMKWDDLQFGTRSYGATAAYNQSKLANVLFANALARRLEGTGVTVNAVHPGPVATELVRELPEPLRTLWGWFTLSPRDGARTSLHVALAEETATVTGAYFEKSRTKKAAKVAHDVEAQERLWQLSERLLGVEARA